jgi:hypothetical protein
MVHRDGLLERWSGRRATFTGLMILASNAIKIDLNDTSIRPH